MDSLSIPHHSARKDADCRNQVKIAIVGTHGTRKSTLVHLLVGKLKEEGLDAGYLSEVASSCPLPINQETTIKAQLWIMLTQIKREIELQSRPHEYLVLDRCVLDNYVYMKRAYELMEPSRRTPADDEMMSMGERLMEGWLPTYTHVFKVDIPNADSLSPDGVRDTSSDFQKDVECRMQALCEKLKSKNVHHIGGSNEARLQKIMGIMRRKTQPDLEKFVP